MIQVNSLSVKLAGKEIIKDISFNLAAGETIVVMGKNGCGKSVLLKAIAGLLPSSGGDVIIDGVNFSELISGGQYSDIVKNGRPLLAYVFQKGGLFDSMNVYDNTAFGLRRLEPDEDIIRGKVLSSLERVGLKGSELKFPSDLSGGMQKRVGLARAVCLEPEIILYDDPTAGLDPILSDSIADLIIDLGAGSGRTAIAVTNDLKVAEKIADKVGLLFEGRFVFYGSGEDFFREADDYLRQFIRGEVEGPIDAY